MISGDKPRGIKYYLHIDHCGEGVGWSAPKEGESFIGIPFSWFCDNSMPYVEVRKGGKHVRSINCSDISVIEFEDEP